MDDTDVRQAWDDRPRASEAIPLASYEAQRGGRTIRFSSLIQDREIQKTGRSRATLDWRIGLSVKRPVGF